MDLIFLFPQSYANEFATIVPIKKPMLRIGFSFISDPGRTQTCNPQSRNLIFYSIELRSQYFFLINYKCVFLLLLILAFEL